MARELTVACDFCKASPAAPARVTVLGGIRPDGDGRKGPRGPKQVYPDLCQGCTARLAIGVAEWFDGVRSGAAMLPELHVVEEAPAVEATAGDEIEASQEGQDVDVVQDDVQQPASDPAETLSIAAPEAVQDDRGGRKGHGRRTAAG